MHHYETIFLLVIMSWDDLDILKHMPFHDLTNYQLSIQYETGRAKYTDLLENNKFQLHLANNVSQSLTEYIFM